MRSNALFRHLASAFRGHRVQTEVVPGEWQAQTAFDPVTVTLADLVRLAPMAQQLQLWQSARQVEDGGDHHTIFKGRGMEFAETRPYQAGDDIRHIDWRVTARTGRAHTKLFREERERPVVVWVDCRAHMFFATRGMFKSVMAARLAALIAWAAHAHGDRIGGRVTGNADSLVLEPERGRHAVLRFLRALEQAGTPGSLGASAATMPEHVTQSLHGLRRNVRPGTIVFFISDFHDLETELADILVQLGAHSDLTVCCIHDPLEAELPPPGAYPIAAADGRRALLYPAEASQREDYASRFHARMQRLQNLSRRHRARYVSATTVEDPVQILRNACAKRSAAARDKPRPA